MTRLSTSVAPYAPRRDFAVPIVSLALTVPALVAPPTAAALALFHAISGRDLSAGAGAILLPSPVFTLAICLILFGPMLALMLCVTQRARAEQTYGADFYLGYRMKRLNTIALGCAGTGLAVVTLTIFSGLLLRAGT
ncbi:MAG TPA: hypothetical protein VF792_11295 [Ktedonobacterales bacterium]